MASLTGARWVMTADRGMGRCLVAALICIFAGLVPISSSTPAAVEGETVAETNGPASVTVPPTVGTFGPVTGRSNPDSTSVSMVPGALLFVENVGQFAEGARFRASTDGAVLFLANDGLWFTVLSSQDLPTAADERPKVRGPGSGYESNSRLRGVNLKVSFEGSNPEASLEPFGRLDAHVSFFRGSDPRGWHPDTPVWSGVRYRDLYPGMDLEITSENRQLVLRLATRNGADLSQVALRVEGSKGLAVLDDALRVTTAVGTFTLPLLDVVGYGDLSTIGFQGAHVSDAVVYAPIAAVRSLEGDPRTDSVSTNGTDDLVYSTLLGGDVPADGAMQWGEGIAVDGNGAAYVTGITCATDFPTTPGAFETSTNGVYDAFVTKLKPDGSGLVYSTLLSGSAMDWGYDIAVDGLGSAYITGFTGASDFPTTPGAFNTTSAGAFVSKLNVEGTGLVYSTFIGGASSESIAIDAAGAAYIAGVTGSVDFPTTQGAFDTTLDGEQDAFVTKLKPDGSGLTYSTFLGGTSVEIAYGVAVDSSGFAYVTGHTYSDDFPTVPGSYDRVYNGMCDGFVAKLKAEGSGLVYSSFLGGNDEDHSFAIAVDSTGNAYLAGKTHSKDFPTTPGAFDPNTRPSTNAFVAKLNAEGSGLAYSTFLSGNRPEVGCGIAVDGLGSAYVTGSTESSDFPTTPGAYDRTLSGSEDTFLTKLSVDGSRLAYSTFFGGSGGEVGADVAIDRAGAVYVTGHTYSTDFPTTADAYDSTPNGIRDVFVYKLRLPSVQTVYLPSVVKTHIAPVYDDFSWTGSGWPTSEADVYALGYINGEYHILVKKPGYLVLAGRNLLATDFAVEVTTRAATNAFGTYGFYFGLCPAGYYVFEVDPYNRMFALSRYDFGTGTWNILIGPTFSEVIRSYTDWNHLRVVRSGANITLYANPYANGGQLGQVTDSTLGEGFVGLAASSDWTEFDAHFDDFVLHRSSAGAISGAEEIATQAESELRVAPANEIWTSESDR